MPRKSYKEKLRELRKHEMRRQMALTLRERGYSLAEIGQRLNPQVSRQRVAQILADK